ncbi:MAG TPA: carbohydrate ABC transporter permease [Chloroflexota bacterium]|nr:carbohydrate ABC transporter permease [Chloroflexota bacterium]
MATTVSSPGTGKQAAGAGRTLGKQALPMVFLFLFSVYFLAPLVWLVFSSTKNESDFSTAFGFWFSGHPQFLANVSTVLNVNDHIYLHWLFNTVLYSVISAVGATLFAAMAGYALSKFFFRGRELLFLIILGSLMVPITALALPLFLIMTDINLGFTHISLINTYAAVILPSLVSPFGVYLMRIYTAGSVSDDLLQAARIDGASEAGIFFRIVLRMTMPGLITVLLFSFVGTWNNYFLPYVVLSDQNYYPLSVGLAYWNGLTNQAGVSDVTYVQVITGALISVIPLVIAFLTLQRYWNNSLTLNTTAG